VPRLSLLPRDRTFFDLFTEAGQNSLHAARLLDQMMGSWPDDEGLGREVLKAEQEGDRITHDIIRRLNSTFVTPIDREDIYGLATRMDDIVDYTEEAADFLALYKIEAPMSQAQALTKVLVLACEQLAAGLRLVWVNGYSDTGIARYAALWRQQPSASWQARHGLTAEGYQRVFDELVAQGFRPTQVSGYGDGFYPA